MRLALRAEGEWWTAYYAQDGTMDEAIPLGRIHIGAVSAKAERRAQWLALMQGVAEDLSVRATGERPGWAAARPVVWPSPG